MHLMPIDHENRILSASHRTGTSGSHLQLEMNVSWGTEGRLQLELPRSYRPSYICRGKAPCCPCYLLTLIWVADSFLLEEASNLQITDTGTCVQTVEQASAALRVGAPESSSMDISWALIAHVVSDTATMSNRIRRKKNARHITSIMLAQRALKTYRVIA